MADQAAYEALTLEELKGRFGEVGRWFSEHKRRLGHGSQLQGPDSATTVWFRADSKPLVKDGLFLEGKEIVGGYVDADVANLDEALAIARSWPGAGTVEIRPVTQRRILRNATASPASALAEFFSEEAGRLTASLVRRFSDFNLAEESIQDALVAALESWPRESIPDRPVRGS